MADEELALAIIAMMAGKKKPADISRSGTMYINRPIKEWLSKVFQMSGLDIRDRISRSIELDMSKVLATLDMTEMLKTYMCIPTSAMDISGALGTVVPATLCNPWSTAALLNNSIFVVTRVVYDVTTANTQLCLGISTTLSDCAPVTLPGTAGFAEDISFIIPPGFYCGLSTTNNGGDASRDLTLYGYCLPSNPNGFNYGGTYYNISLDGLT